MKVIMLFRRKLVPAILVLAGCNGVLVPAFAQETTPYEKINAEAAASPIAVQRVRGRVSVLEGSGGNIGVLDGREGLLLVDDGIAVSRRKLESALREISPRPLRYVINTHWHWDHTDGNAWAHEDGATIIGHDNTVKHLNEAIRVVEWGHTFEPVSRAARPTVRVSTEKTLNMDGERVRIRYYGPSHTDGDLSVFFPNADVLFTGDTWWNGLYPFIDYVAGGSIDGMIRAAEANIAMSTDHTLIVPGHGPVGTRAELIEYRDMLVSIRSRVAALKHQGLSLDQAISAKPTEQFDSKWGRAIISPALFTALIYRGVSAEQ